MKKLNLYLALAALAAGSAFFSCKRDNALKDPANRPASDVAFISLIDVAPNLSTVLGVKADTFNVLFNGVKVTGYTAGTTPVMTMSNIYPLPGTNTGYAAIASGDQTIKFARGVNTLDSVVLTTFNETLQAGSYYTLLITDSIRSSQDASRIFLKDEFKQVDSLTYNIRFVNTVLNDTANVDIWSNRQAKNIFSNVKPGAVVDFIQYPSSWTSDTLICRRAGTKTNLDVLNTQTLYGLKTYTLVYEGDAKNAASKDPKRHHLVTYVNH